MPYTTVITFVLCGHNSYSTKYNTMYFPFSFTLPITVLEQLRAKDVNTFDTKLLELLLLILQ